MILDSAALAAKPHENGAGAGSYWLLLALQSLGTGTILFNGLPIYRELARNFSDHQRNDGILWWGLAGVALAQSGYWLRVKISPSLPALKQMLLGHLLGFASRLAFVLASSSFAVIFLVRLDEMALTPRRIILLLALLFSLYCWSLELERLGRALQGSEVRT